MDKMKRILTLVCLCSFGLVGVLSCLPTFAGEELVAPIRNPLVCAYFRLRESFEFLMRERKPRADSRGIEAVDFLRSAAGSASRFRDSIRAKGGNGPHKDPVVFSGNSDPSPILKFLGGTKRFLPEELFIYFKSPGEYLFYVAADCDPESFREFFDPETVLPRPEGFSVSGMNNRLEGRQPLIHFGKRRIFLCPAEIEGNILDALQSKPDNLGDEFKTFRNMIRFNPILAAEANFSALHEQIRGLVGGGSGLPSPFSKITLFRLFIDARMVKAQAYAPDEVSREVIAVVARDLVSALKAWLVPPAPDGASEAGSGRWKPLADSLRDFTEGTSVFIESTGLKEGTVFAGIAALGIFSSLSQSSFPFLKPEIGSGTPGSLETKSLDGVQF